MTSCCLIISAYNQARQIRLVFESILEQTMMPDEILIADDGSSDELPDVVAYFARRLGGTRVSHLFQEDRGFRKTIIVNRAFRESTSEYLICLDGDMILHRRFVENHLRYRSRGRVLCGYRGVKLGREHTEALLTGRRKFNPSVLDIVAGAVRGELTHPIRGFELRSPWLRRWLIPARGGEWPTPTYLGGGNFSIHRGELVRVNGYDETILTYSFEDFELGVRLQRAGLRLVNVTSCCITYHLWHPQPVKRISPELRARIRRRGAAQCRSGIFQLDAGTAASDFLAE